MKKIIIVLMMLLIIPLVAAFDWANSTEVYLNLNQTTGNATDSTGNHGDAVVTNVLNQSAIGINETAYEFEDVGQDDRVQFNWSEPTWSDEFTACLWFNLEDYGAFNGNVFLTAMNTTGDSTFRMLVRGDNDYLQINLYNSTGDLNSMQTFIPDLDTWYHACLWYNGTNMSLYINGTYNQSIAMTGNVRTTTDSVLIVGSAVIGTGGNSWTDGTIDEVGIWSRALTTAEISELATGISYLRNNYVDVILSSPLNNTAISDVGTNFTADYFVNGYNLTNATYYVWKGGIEFNVTSVDVTGDTSNSTTLYIDDFTLGSYEWNVYACGTNATGSLCSWAENNYTFDAGASINSENYSNYTYETDYETFEVNITLLSGTNLYDAQLNYNGTFYESTITDGGNDNYLLTSSFDIPLVETGDSVLYSWYWRLTYEKPDQTFVFQNLDARTQNVTRIYFLNCSGGGTNETLNFTAYNEETLDRITPYDFYGTFEYWLGSGTITRNTSIADPSVSAQYFCISPENYTFYSDADIQYEKTGFVKRNYYLINSSLTNTSSDIELFFLNTSSSTSFIIDVIDSSQRSITNAYLYIQRYYHGTGTYKTIEMAKTDDEGSTIGHYEAETEDYKVIIVKDGVILLDSNSQKVFCRTTPCTIQYQTEGITPNRWNNFGNISSLIWSLDYDNDTRVWTYTYVDVSGTTNYGRLLVYRKEGSRDTIICNSSDSSSAATITCNVSAYEGTTYAEIYISRSPEILIYMKSAVWNVLKETLGLAGLFWGLIILLVMALIGVSIGAAAGILLIIAGIILINVIGIASFGPSMTMGAVIIGLVILWGMRR